MTTKGYRAGSHRAHSPEVTLERIRPFVSRYGITRLADVTGLDSLGIPTYCAIRPRALTLQVSNGKGSRPIDAQVSALMEGIELAHGEAPPARPLRLASEAEMAACGEPFSVDVPAHARPDRHPQGRIEWVCGDELGTDARVWLPASTAWVRPRQAFGFDWNGLASGNTLAEATLHALYEILERHVLSGLVAGLGLDFSGADIIDLASIDDALVADLVARISDAGQRLVLIRASSELRIHAFMAVLLDANAFAGVSHVNVGYGAHLSPLVAAARAITEAAQSRLTYIHGAREDLRKESYQRGAVHTRLFDFFAALEADTAWEELVDASGDTLEDDLALLLDSIRENGLGRVYRIDLSHDDTPFSVVKVLIPRALLTIPA